MDKLYQVIRKSDLAVYLKMGSNHFAQFAKDRDDSIHSLLLPRSVTAVLNQLKRRKCDPQEYLVREVILSCGAQMTGAQWLEAR